MKKIVSVLFRNLIYMFDGINNHFYTTLYWNYLKYQGVKFNGRPNYISSSAYLDGQGYNIISIGKDVVISREVMLLTHDFSVETALHSVGKGTDNRTIHLNLPITIGDNSFIGARASILPGTTIGNDCIIGACAVVKGNIPEGSVVIGNPAKIIGSIDEIAGKHRHLFDKPNGKW